ncbi:AsmA-like C-terminal region-containing protein [Pseudopedobacter beijingensis]|uniref:AsmA-like C-terminal region-containing protein n=1 Tax=Pseudopedobacter beijingensis TaxID=1207056 RepID=A0ABW4IFS9_9SPHI
MLKKTLIIIAVVFGIFIIAAACIPLFFKDTIVEKVKTSINNNVNAKVSFNDLDLTIISSFPKLGIQLNDLKVVGIDSFATDTLANIKSLKVNLNIMSVIKGDKYEINSVDLREPKIYARVLKSGKANWDIMKPDTTEKAPGDTTPTNFKAALKKYSIEKGNVVYDDASMNFYLAMDNLNHSGKGDFTQDLFVLDTDSEIEKLTLKYAGIPYLNGVTLKAKLPLDIDMKQMKFTLGKNQILLNELVLSLVGSLAMPNDTDMLVDVKFNAEKSDLKNFLSLIPAIYSENFKDMQATGKFGLNGFAKGTYNEQSLPAFDVDLTIENGKIKYNALPSAINDIQVKANIANPDGNLDHTTVNIPAFHLAFDKAPLDGKLIVKTPMSDPYVDMALKGTLDLKQLTTIFPLKDIKLDGILHADVMAAGNKSTIDRGNYEAFKAQGTISAKNFNYSGAQVPKPVQIPTAQMSISPRNITLSNLIAKVGKSDFNAQGTVNNYLSYVFQKGKPLQGSFSTTSNLIDVNELMGPPSATESKSADTSKLTIIEVPKNIDFKLGVKAKQLYYDNYDIKNAQGALDIKNQTVTFRNLAMDMLDGAIKMNGYYSTTDVKKPKVDVDLSIEKVSIQKAFKTFNTVKLLAPIAQYTNGIFTTNLKFNSDLGPDMMPVYSSIDASGMANIIEAVLEGFEPINKLASSLNVAELKKLELKNVLAKFKIDDGRLQIAPFDIKKNDILMNVQGSNGLDQSMDYKVAINIPRTKLGGQANEAANALLASLNSKAGTNIALGDMIKFNALVGGTIKKPTVKLDLLNNDPKGEATAIVNQVIADKKAELESKVREEATKATEKAKAEAQQKVDTLKKQAEESLKNEVKNQLNNLFKKK